MHPAVRWSLEERVPGVGEHECPLIPVDGVLGPLPDLNSLLNPVFVFIALRSDDLCVVPVHDLIVTSTVI